MRLMMLDPSAALHDYWRQSSPETHIVIGTGGFSGWIAHVDWAAVIAFSGLLLMTLGGVLIQLRKQWVLAGLEIDAARRRASAIPLIKAPCSAATVPPSA